MKQDDAFTGLEAAIVLISCVVVAAVFSHVMLSAGFFGSQSAQDAAYAGVKVASSNVVIDGSMYASISAEKKLDGFTFNVRVPSGGGAVDMGLATFLFSSSNTEVPTIVTLNEKINGNIGASVAFQYPTCVQYPCYNVYYPYMEMNGCNVGDTGCANTVLTSGEFATYMVSIDDGTKGMALGAKEWFTLEMRPRVGAATIMTKTIASAPQNGEAF